MFGNEVFKEICGPRKFGVIQDSC